MRTERGEGCSCIARVRADDVDREACGVASGLDRGRGVGNGLDRGHVDIVVDGVDMPARDVPVFKCYCCC